jgi:inner membrane protein
VHIQTHILSGWCIANQFNLTPRERAFSMIAATIADLDGLGILFGQQYYWQYHHKLAHNLFFGLLSSALLAAFSKQKLKTFPLYLTLFHLHLLMDYFGSGPGWHIHYLWPFGNLILINPNAWDFYSWQNLLTFLLFFLWTLWIARQQGRTPIETLTPRLDKEIVATLRRFTYHRSTTAA